MNMRRNRAHRISRQGAIDKARLDWLQNNPGCNLISDDGCRWAVSTGGFQPIPERGGFKDAASITSFIESREWRRGVRAAIDLAREGSHE